MAIEHEHLPWIGPDYADQTPNQRLLIVGFSHYGRYDPDGSDGMIAADDSPDFTRNVFRRWALNGDIRFFNAIAAYFGEDRAAFWNRVAFANTLPTTVGDEDARYSDGTEEQRDAVEGRVLRLIAELKPARIFVFSRKAWNIWPAYTGELDDGTLSVDGVGEADCGTYVHGDGEAIAFGLRHPQYASTAEMIAMVRAALAFHP